MEQIENGKVSRDETRAALLNGYRRKTKILTVEDGVSILIMEPTVAQRGRMLQSGGVSGSNTDISNISGMQLAAVIECCYDPQTKKRLFEPTDLDVLQSLPASSWFDEVAGSVMEMMSKESAEAGKPSPEIPSDSISSTSPMSSDGPSPSLRKASL